MIDVPVLVLLGIAVLAIALSAVLSAGEAALARLSRADANELVAAGRRNADRVLDLVLHPVPVAASAAFFRVAGEMATAVCLTVVFLSWIPVWWLAFLAAVVASVLVSLVLVGLSPRSIGRSHPEGVLLALSGVLVTCERLTRPFMKVVERSTRSMSRRRDVATVSTDELRTMVDRASEADALEEDEREMIHSVFDLGETVVREVMVPRTDMVTIRADATLAQAVRLFVRSGFSRVPVIGNSVDDLFGVLYFKDVVRRISQDNAAGAMTVDRAMRQAVFVPESKPVDDLLREMQRDATHMAIVVDEYGGIAGLVTMEDLVEEIVGELTDEHDHDQREVEPLPGGAYRVPARLDIEELGELFGIDIDDDDVESTGGLLAKALGRVPIPGARTVVHGIQLVAEQAEGRRKQVSTIIASRVADAVVEAGVADGGAGFGNGRGGSRSPAVAEVERDSNESAVQPDGRTGMTDADASEE